MDDLISRQDAIDALRECQTYLFNTQDPDKKISLKSAEYAIEDLPSAQPEIIQCEDCEWWEKQKDSLQGRCELMQMYPTGAWYCGNAQRRVTDG